MNKVYSRIIWKNYPNTSTAINETNLNRMDKAIDDLDNRVIEQDSTKANQTTVNNMVKNWTMDETTGVITVEKQDGSKIMFDLNIEKIPVTFELSPSGILTMTTSDGTQFTANIGAMIPVLTFNESDQIAVSVSGSGINKTYSFSIKDNSITENKLQPNFLADIKVQSASASLSASNAETSATQAQSYAVGGTGTRENEDTDNAMYYYEQSKKTDIGQLSLKVDEISSNLSELQDNVDSSDIQYSAYIKNANGDITPSAITSSPKISEVVSQINNNIGVLLQGHNEQKSKLDNISIDTIDRERGEITFKGIDFSAELKLLKIGNQLELLRGKIYTVGSYFSVTSGDVLSFALSVSEFGDYINGLKTTAKLAFSAQGIFDSKVIGMIEIGDYISSSGDKGVEVTLRFNDSYDFSSANVRSGTVQFDF